MNRLFGQIKQRFSLRKCSFGVASILIGISFLGASPVFAEESVLARSHEVAAVNVTEATEQPVLGTEPSLVVEATEQERSESESALAPVEEMGGDAGLVNSRPLAEEELFLANTDDEDTVLGTSTLTDEEPLMTSTDGEKGSEDKTISTRSLSAEASLLTNTASDADTGQSESVKQSGEAIKQLEQALKKEAASKVTDHWRANRLETIAQEIKRQEELGIEHYVVQWGDTLSTIAAASQQELQVITALNKITHPDVILTGQTLIGVLRPNATSQATLFELERRRALAGVSRTWSANTVEDIKKEVQRQSELGLEDYLVQWGDTLSVISVASGKNLIKLADLNELSDASKIKTGQVLKGVLNRKDGVAGGSEDNSLHEESVVNGLKKLRIELENYQPQTEDESYDKELALQYLELLEKHQKDTDFDGLTDYEEENIVRTFVNKIDTDDNGVKDSDEDFDEDGLTNREELYNYNTNPLFNDTDYDDLTDYDELVTYKTNPLLDDTDEDGASDGWEIQNGFNPKEFNRHFSITKDFTQESGSKVTVSGNFLGKQAESLNIQNSYERLLLEEIPGLIEKAVDLTTNGEINSARLGISFDKTKLADNAQPVIYYFNKENQILEELPTIIEGDTAYTELLHFSDYVLLDKTILEEVKARTLKKSGTEEDTNKDGIPNYFTRAIFEGNLLTGVYTKVFKPVIDDIKGLVSSLSDDDLENKLTSDYDKDGLENGKEIEVAWSEKNNHYYLRYNSDPMSSDSDGDGHYDKDEAKSERNRWNVGERDLMIFAKMAYDNFDGETEKNTPENDEKRAGNYAVLALDVSHSDRELFKKWKKLNASHSSFLLGDFNAVTYVNGDTAIIAFRGTDDNQIAINDYLFKFDNDIPVTELIQDLQIGLGNSSQEGPARKYAKEIAKLSKLKNIYLTGHSLGGYLSYMGGYELRNDNRLKDVYNFNGPGYTIFDDRTQVLEFLNRIPAISNASKMIETFIAHKNVEKISTHSYAIGPKNTTENQAKDIVHVFGRHPRTIQYKEVAYTHENGEKDKKQSFYAHNLTSFAKHLIQGYRNSNKYFEENTDNPEINLTTLFPNPFSFSAGAGGWWTSLQLLNNNEFEGSFIDNDLGVTGPAHPNGSRSISNFKGRFGNIEKLNDFEYRFELVDLEYPEVGKISYHNGVEITTAHPYGVHGGKEFRLYLPGRTTKDLSNDLLRWGYNYGGIVDEESNLSQTLLVNVEKQLAFVYREDDVFVRYLLQKHSNLYPLQNFPKNIVLPWETDRQSSQLEAYDMSDFVDFYNAHRPEVYEIADVVKDLRAIELPQSLGSLSKDELATLSETYKSGWLYFSGDRKMVEVVAGGRGGAFPEIIIPPYSEWKKVDDGYEIITSLNMTDVKPYEKVTVKRNRKSYSGGEQRSLFYIDDIEILDKEFRLNRLHALAKEVYLQNQGSNTFRPQDLIVLADDINGTIQIRENTPGSPIRHLVATYRLNANKQFEVLNVVKGTWSLVSPRKILV